MQGNKAGEMFTNSYLKTTTPLQQLLFTLALSGAALLVIRLFFFSYDMVAYVACFALVFFAVINPWVLLFSNKPIPYVVKSIPLYLLNLGIIWLTVEGMCNKNLFAFLDFRIILISASFYYVVALLSVRVLRLFLNEDGGGL